MTKVKEYPVIWLQGGSCTGCSVSILNSLSPTVKNVLIDEVVPGKHINLKFQATVMAGQGMPVLKLLEDTKKDFKNGYIFVVEGSIPTKDEGSYCIVGEESMLKRVIELGKNSLVNVGLGTCSCFGGIPAASPNPTGCKGISEIFKEYGINVPLINIPGCPPHPDWFIGTVAYVLILGLPEASLLDEHLRPKTFYGKLIHENCPRRAYFDEGKFAKKLSDEECLYELGCKGPVTYADCFLRKWNSGVNWCIDNNHPCIGCCEPTFPDSMSPFFEKITDVQIPSLGDYWKSKGGK